MGERHDLRLEPAGWDAAGVRARPRGAGWRAVAAAVEPRRAAAGRRPGAAGPGHARRSAPASVWRDRGGAGARRLRPEPDRLGPAAGRRASRDRDPGAARRGAGRRRPPVHREPADRAAGRRVRDRRRPGGPRAAVHPARLPVRGDSRLPGRAGARRRHGPGGALRHPRRRLVRVLDRDVARPALPRHGLGPARQLHQRADRLPAAGRAPRLARRRPDLRPHRLLQPRRRRVLRQVARRRGRRPAPVGRVPRHRAPAAHPLGRARRPGRTRG